MQPIKFRGKQIDNGKWVYGYLIFMNNKIAYIADMGIVKFDDDEKIKKYILNIEEPYNLGEIYKVIPETVGQFTECLDKNKKELYHNDIVKTWNKNISYIYYEKGYWRIGKRGRIIKEYEWETFEKIGNVFDNPELLKKEN